MRIWRIADAALAAGAGVVAAFGFPPDGIGWLTLAALAVLAWRLPGASPRRAAALAWLFATAWHFTALSWVSEAFRVTFPDMGPVSYLPVAGLAAGLALFWTLAVYLWRRFWPAADQGGAPAFLGLAAALGLGEWLMGHLFTGFPWALAALAFAEDPMLAQHVRALGTYGLSLTLIAAPLALAGAFARAVDLRTLPVADTALALIAVAITAAPWDRLPTERAAAAAATPSPRSEPAPAAGAPPAAAAARPAVDAGDPETWPVIRMVQGNIPQRIKWQVENRTAIFVRHLQLSRAPAPRPLAAIVWPETATPFRPDASPEAMQALASVAPPGGYVILGAPLRRQEADGREVHTNSLIAVDPTGAIVARYDKAHLVPGGEYVPFEEILPFGKLVEGRGSFTPGPGVKTVDLPGLPAFSPLICYEVIFPGAVAVESDRPAFLLNVTNDAWYGASAGPHQHLAIARLRAIEEGLPLIRVANTGISAAFDGRGREIGRIPLQETNYLDVALPPPEAETVYARYGDALFFALTALFAAVGFALSRPRRRTA